MLVSDGPDEAIIYWDLKGNPNRGRWLPGHQDSVLSIDFSPDSSVLASGGADQSIILWDVGGGRYNWLTALFFTTMMGFVKLPFNHREITSHLLDAMVKLLLWGLNEGVGLSQGN